MKNFVSVLALSCLFACPVMAEEEHSQEYYDQQVAEGMKAMTAQLQLMSGEMVKYMNAVNKALNESVPQMSDDMVKVLSTMKPLAENMQKNIDNFAQQVNQELNTETNTEEKIVAPEKVVVPEITTDDHLSEKIDEELAQFEAPRLQEPQQNKIKLFPSSIE
jgi:hypothetical protein